jgi:hypothetical protein
MDFDPQALKIMNREARPKLLASHGSQKQAESSDPLEMVGALLAGGDTHYLARCLIEELAGLGYGADEIFALCLDPEYAGLHMILRREGTLVLWRLIRETLAGCGVTRVSVEEFRAPEEGAP